MTTVIELQQVDSLFQDLEEKSSSIDYETVMIESLELLAEGEQQQFNAGASAAGERWAPNATSTIKNKRHGIVLFDTGTLETSLVTVGADHNIHETSKWGLLFGTDLPYSLFNQEGTSRIPARPHVGMTEALLNAIVEEVADFTIEALKE